MNIEKLETHVTLKSGSKVFPPKVYEAPNIPTELVQEAMTGTKNITILVPPVAQEKLQEEKIKNDTIFLSSWKELEAGRFKTFILNEGNRGKITAAGQINRATAKWFRFFPSEPFPGTEKVEVQEKVEDVPPEKIETVVEKPKKTKKLNKPKLVKRSKIAKKKA